MNSLFFHEWKVNFERKPKRSKKIINKIILSNKKGIEKEQESRYIEYTLGLEGPSFNLHRVIKTMQNPVALI